LDSTSCETRSEVSPLIWGRLSPAAQAIRIWGSANSSALHLQVGDVGAQVEFHPAGPDARAHQQDRSHHGKAEQRQRCRQCRKFLVIEVEQGGNRLWDGQVRGQRGFRRDREGGGKRNHAVARQ
jgi:hypothetical protein